MIVEAIKNDKIDYRITEIVEASPTTEIKAILILARTPSSDIVNQISAMKDLTVAKVMPSIMVIKVKGKARAIADLAEKDFVKHIVLEELLSKEF